MYGAAENRSLKRDKAKELLGRPPNEAGRKEGKEGRKGITRKEGGKRFCILYALKK